MEIKGTLFKIEFLSGKTEYKKNMNNKNLDKVKNLDKPKNLTKSKN